MRSGLLLARLPVRYQCWSAGFVVGRLTGGRCYCILTMIDQEVWAIQHRVQLCIIRPWSPVENGSIENFNGRLRDECLKRGLVWLTAPNAQETGRVARSLQPPTPAPCAGSSNASFLCQHLRGISASPRSNRIRQAADRVKDLLRRQRTPP